MNIGKFPQICRYEKIFDCTTLLATQCSNYFGAKKNAP